MRARLFLVIGLAILSGELLLNSATGTAFGLPQTYVVVSGSMVPVLNVGTIVIAQPIPYDNLKVGDIIVYHSPDGLDIVHRIVSITPQGIQTKGDANPAPDEPTWWPYLQANQIKGEVLLSIPYAGLLSIYVPMTDRFLFAFCLLAFTVVYSLRKKQIE